MTVGTTRAKPTTDLYYWSHTSTPLGDLFALSTGNGLRRLIFGVSEGEFLTELGDTPVEHNTVALAGLMRQIEAYFSGEHVQFSTPLDLRDRTPFQREVMRHVYAIPVGETRTYGQLAKELGCPKAARAVGSVMAANPIPLVVPCHRVVTASGGLGGYSSRGGLSDKRYLLTLEGAM